MDQPITVQDIVLYPHLALSRKAEQRPVDVGMLDAGAALLEAARSVGAYGLAAAHIGLNEPLVVISVAGEPAQRDYRILYNPTVTATATESAMGAEGSVSLPGIEVPVERPIWAEVDFDDSIGERQTMRLEGFVACVALHEIDQMNGVFFLNRVSRLKRDTALRKYQKSLR